MFVYVVYCERLGRSVLVLLTAVCEVFWLFDILWLVIGLCMFCWLCLLCLGCRFCVLLGVGRF